MIDIGLAALRTDYRGEAKAGKPRIAERAQVRCRHGVAAESEEIERAALEAVGDLRPGTAMTDQVVAIARRLEELELFVGGPTRERVACAIIKTLELRLAGIRQRQRGNER